MDIGLRSWTIQNLAPYSSYQFRVRAVNFYGVGEPSSPMDPVRTTIAAPRKYPSGLGARDGKVGTVNVSWDSFPKIEWGFTSGWFKVTWLYIESSSSGTPTWVLLRFLCFYKIFGTFNSLFLERATLENQKIMKFLRYP